MNGGGRYCLSAKRLNFGQQSQLDDAMTSGEVSDRAAYAKLGIAGEPERHAERLGLPIIEMTLTVSVVGG